MGILWSNTEVHSLNLLILLLCGQGFPKESISAMYSAVSDFSYFILLFSDGKVSELALDALLRRCSDVLVKYVEDEKLSGKCPLPR